MTSQPPAEYVPAAYPPPPFPAPPPPTIAPPPPPYGQPYGVGAEEPLEAGATEPRRRLSRFAPRSLASRLVVGVVALVVVLVLATGIGTYVALRSYLFNRLDQQVTGVADNNARQVGICILTLGPGCTLSGSPSSGVRSTQRSWLTILQPNGSTIGTIKSGTDLESMGLSQAQGSAILADPTRTRSVSTPDGTLRVVGRVIGPPVDADVAVFGLSTAEVDHTLNRLVQLEFIIGLAAILVAFGATTYGVRYSLRRLHGVTRTAQEVAAELSPSGAGLDRRVEVTERDTEVGQLAESMNTLLAAVETQFAARLANEERMRQFLADASHELRTPLTSIRGYAELSRMQAGGESTEADNLARIEAEGTRMSRLVDDLLTLARTDQNGEREHEPLDAGDVVVEAIEGVRAAYPDRPLDVTAEHGLTVLGDRDQLVRVVRNLATNAAVHTRPGGPIRVSATGEQGMVVLRISDSGPGLPPEQAAHVFERFWRADTARSRTQGGSGLGLAIVAALVQSHRGAVRFDSTVEGGSTVTVRLPRAPGVP
ncbi:MAG: two-component system, OmpR family, sensor kinase [Pseudonocardiales bacterium]|nr:two-component system, OmpR family, sensor kinase [Pseudonocardiales bacterium]